MAPRNARCNFINGEILRAFRYKLICGRCESNGGPGRIFPNGTGRRAGVEKLRLVIMPCFYYVFGLSVLVHGRFVWWPLQVVEMFENSRQLIVVIYSAHSQQDSTILKTSVIWNFLLGQCIITSHHSNY